MSAYKDLEALLGGSPLARKMLNTMLNEHAHELAEKIRDHVTPPEDWQAVYVTACIDSANLIDPEVES